ncbi:riboflavin synthase [Legionella rowbothamii]|uniref:riboflavin synthase n=1 Tax=Legionella rowbothamii TaxID=96229 RepID=UPI001054666D|nr:riboflavin synthase [Legionella rowbothamii]
MFTGIIEKKGLVLNNLRKENDNRLIIAPVFEQLQVGESIAVNGVCLTLLPTDNNELHFDVSPETLNVTTLANLTAGHFVNLERAMLASTRFGGHYVSGHVDAIATVRVVNQLEEYLEVELAGFQEAAMAYLLPKGSITVEGVSLTINSVGDRSIKLMLVPHTSANTTLSALKPGQQVNIEFDYLTRIVAHQLRVSGQLA